MSNLAVNFKHARVLRVVNDDTILCDPEFGGHCGYLSFAEAEVLRKIGAAFPGDWAEVGSHTGWSSAHLALSGNRVTAVDPEYAYNPLFLQRAKDNWAACGLTDKLTPWGGYSYDFFRTEEKLWDGIFIDGDHGFPAPAWDAMWAALRLKKEGVIAFHDHVGDPVKHGVEILRLAGFNVKVYPTPQQVALCWRGNCSLPEGL